MSFKVYPVTETGEKFGEYTVKINGQKVETNTCRVSKEPFNRRWPGHQRQKEQSELAAFVLAETDQPLDFEITTEKSFEKVEIRPLSLGIKPETDGKNIKFRLEKPAYFTVEPFGRHEALHIFADDVREFDVSREDVIYFGKGEHDVGEIEVGSNQTVYIDEGAVVYACIKAIDADNIKILGNGILDNSRNKEEILFEVNAENNDAAVGNAKRKHTLQLEYCTNVLIDGITIRDSLVYNIRPIGCTNLDIRNVKIIGCWRFNSDGIDMHNCINVHISNCFIRTFDDSVCVKGFDCYYDGDVEKAVHEAMYRNGKSYDVFENVLVENCVVWNDWGKCLEIGAETRAEEICGICFKNCDVIHVSGNVLDCMNVDYADIHDVVYENINVEYDDVIPASVIQKNDRHKYSDEKTNPDAVPALICSEVVYHPEYSAGGERRGRNRNILFKNIRLTGRQKVVVHAGGFDAEHKSSDITIDGLYVNGKKINSLDECEFTQNEFCENITLK